MKLNQRDFFLLSRCAVTAAYQAGQIIASYSKNKIKINKKAGADSLASQVVTEVDLLSQEIILKHILPTCEIYDLAFLTEESIDDKSRLKKDFFWCIDPLDGTLPFIEKKSGYAVSIALVSQNGIPYIGVVYDPLTQTLNYAIKDQGAYENHQQLKFGNSKLTENKTLTVIFDRNFVENENFKSYLKQLTSLAKKYGYNKTVIIKHGGAVMNACWVLKKSPAVYFKFPKKNPGGGSLWDFAATACIFNETDAFVSDIYGNPLELNRLDSTFMNHNGVLYSSSKKLADMTINFYKNLSL